MPVTITDPDGLTVAPDELVLAIDIGGTKMAAGVVDGTGKVHQTARVPSPARLSAEDMWSALEKVTDEVLDDAGRPELKAIGVGCAGPMVWPDGVVSPTNITAWRGFPLRRHLMNRFPGLPVRVHNDAIAMAAAEHWMGAAAPHANVLGMVVSTGVGGGFIIGNRLIDGGLGNAGHIGHIVVDPDGPKCPCGGRGCLEAIARGPSTAAWAVEQGWTPSDTSKPVDAKSLAEDARAGDLVAIAAYRRSGEAVGIALASVAALLDLDVAVIGGGVVQSGPLLMTPLKEAFDRHAGLEFARRMQIKTAKLDQDAGIVGAAALVIRGDRYWNPKNA